MTVENDVVAVPLGVQIKSTESADVEVKRVNIPIKYVSKYLREIFRSLQLPLSF